MNSRLFKCARVLAIGLILSLPLIFVSCGRKIHTINVMPNTVILENGNQFSRFQICEGDPFTVKCSTCNAIDEIQYIWNTDICIGCSSCGSGSVQEISEHFSLF